MGIYVERSRDWEGSPPYHTESPKAREEVSKKKKMDKTVLRGAALRQSQRNKAKDMRCETFVIDVSSTATAKPADTSN